MVKVILNHSAQKEKCSDTIDKFKAWNIICNEIENAVSHIKFGVTSNIVEYPYKATKFQHSILTD